MPYAPQPFVNRQLSTDVEYLQRNSPDVLVDMGVLMHVITKRQWNGPYKGWADVPVAWLATRSHLGHRRVKASLDRLAGYGMLTAMSTNGHRGALALNYRYDIRPEYEKLEEEEKVVEEEIAILKHLPMRADGAGAYGSVMVFDFNMFTPKYRKVAPTDYAAMPVCTSCGKVYHPTEGRGPNEGQCAVCYVKDALQKSIDTDKAWHTMQGPTGTERKFTRAEMDAYVEKY
jgi:hypothetical protein